MSFGLKLVWDEWNVDHIKKHAVTRSEVEEAYKEKALHRILYNNRIVMLGKTKAGRFVTFVCSQEKQTDYYIVSARDMSKKERRWYREQTKTDQAIQND